MKEWWVEHFRCIKLPSRGSLAKLEFFEGKIRKFLQWKRKYSLSRRTVNKQHLELERDKKNNEVKIVFAISIYALHPLLIFFFHAISVIRSNVKRMWFVTYLHFSDADAHTHAIEAYSLIKNSLNYVSLFVSSSSFFSFLLFSSFWHSREYSDTPRARHSQSHTHSNQRLV